MTTSQPARPASTSRPVIGRPEVGPAFSVRFPADLLARVDRAAADGGMTRAAWLRQAAAHLLDKRR